MESDDKSQPPVLVRREKRSSSTPRSPATQRRVVPTVHTSRSPSPNNVLHDDVSPPSNERMQHVYPDVIIVERGRAGKADISHMVVTGKQSRYSDSDGDDTLLTDKTESTMKLCHITDDDINASLKDYTYMYKKDDNSDSTKTGCFDKRQVDQTDYDACSDISSVSSSIVDYVRRSLTEVGVSTTSGESREEQPPPLPAKTATHRRTALDCEMNSEQVVQDDVVMASTWEPTHMTWDEVNT